MTEITVTLDNILLDLQRLMRAHTVKEGGTPQSLLAKAREQERSMPGMYSPPPSFQMTPKVALMSHNESDEELYDAVKQLNRALSMVQGDVDTLSGVLMVTIQLTHPNWRWNQGAMRQFPIGTHAIAPDAFIYQPALSASMIARHRNTAFSAFDRIRQLELMLEHELRYVKPSDIHTFRRDIQRNITDQERTVIQTWRYLVRLKDQMNEITPRDHRACEWSQLRAELSRLSACVKPHGINVMLSD